MDPVCTNGHHIDDYPDTYRGAERIGINFRGNVEYGDEDEGVVYELVYVVADDAIDSLRQHRMLGEGVDSHVETSVERFGEWRHVEDRE